MSCDGSSRLRVSRPTPASCSATWPMIAHPTASAQRACRFGSGESQDIRRALMTERSTALTFPDLRRLAGRLPARGADHLRGTGCHGKLERGSAGPLKAGSAEARCTHCSALKRSAVWRGFKRNSASYGLADPFSRTARRRRAPAPTGPTTLDRARPDRAGAVRWRKAADGGEGGVPGLLRSATLSRGASNCISSMRRPCPQLRRRAFLGLGLRPASASADISPRSKSSVLFAIRTPTIATQRSACT